MMTAHANTAGFQTLLVDLIQSNRAPSAFFLFGERSGVISPGSPLCALLLSDTACSDSKDTAYKDIALRPNAAVTSTILVYQTSRLSRIKGNHRNFLYNVFTHGELLYKKEGFEIPKITTVPTDHAAKVAYWVYCMGVATDCLKAREAAGKSALVSAMLLRQAAEMVALGLIYMCLDCRPGNIGLRNLFNLCALFMPQVDVIFPLNGEVGRSLEAVFSVSPVSMMYRGAGPASADLEQARERVAMFAIAARPYVREPFKKWPESGSANII